MIRQTRRAVVSTALALLATSTAFLGVAGPASGTAAACTPADEPPQVLSLTADDVTFLGVGPGQEMHVTVQNACGGTLPYQCDRTPTTSCTGVDLQLRRSGTLGSRARSCNHLRITEDSGSAAGPVATGRVDVFDYPLSVSWSLEYLDDTGQPAMTNACAGPWDVIATARNTTRVNGTSTVTWGDPFKATAVFSLYRASRLTTKASPEPVRRAATVTVRGRLTRQMLAPDRLSTNANGGRYVGFAGERVVLQRRTLSGSYNNIKSVRSNKHGYVLTRLVALRTDRCYRWLYRGSATTLAATASGDCVHVRR